MSTRHVWRLARRPAGTIVAHDFRFGSEPIPELSDGQYLTMRFEIRDTAIHTPGRHRLMVKELVQ